MNTTESNSPSQKNKLLLLCVAALGVVFGDIGTSPLYAFRACFSDVNIVAVTSMNVIGVISLVFWALFMVVTMNYLVFLFKVDNRGEGGILALLAMLSTRAPRWSFIIPLGIFGAALLYGDGIITPAISVLSAVEGLEIGTPLCKPYIVPITIAVLFFLFLVQKNGTARIGSVFGFFMIIWFLTMACLGLGSVIKTPEVLQAFNPYYAFTLLSTSPKVAFFVLGAVFLSITGAEVLYADMGHFGKKPIRLNWCFLVFPALMLNYMGQGAYLLREPEHVENLFYRLAPEFLLYPLVGLATLATVIAAQAVISGIFSLTSQAIQLGFWPRLSIIHTSKEKIGQIYLPEINWILFSGTTLLVLIFKDSNNLAGAYGSAVSGTMLITSVIAIVVIPQLWSSKFQRYCIFFVVAIFLCTDITFFTANSLKILHGGWIPLTMGFFICALCLIWRKGRELMRHSIIQQTMSIKVFADSLRIDAPLQVKGLAVFLSGNDGVPRILLHNLKHNKVLHDRTIILKIVAHEVPFISNAERAEFAVYDTKLGLYGVTLNYGFCENPNIPEALKQINVPEVNFTKSSISYFIGKESIVFSQRKKRMWGWQKRIFLLMSRNAHDITAYYGLPPNQVTEFGIQVEL
jgi:KUP system potassium uptake protein